MLIIFYDLLLLLLLSSSTSPSVAQDPPWHNCDSDSNYTMNSTFESNLKLLLTTLNSSTTNFTTSFSGSSPDIAYGLILCRGDIGQSDCQTCIQNAAQNVLSLCPFSKQATIWYDYCELRYDYLRFFSYSYNSGDYWLHNPNNATDPGDGFLELEKELLDRVTNYAAYTSSVMFATGTAHNYNTSGLQETIYGLAQCTRDLSNDTCNDCLQQLLADYAGFAQQIKQGGRVLGKSCNFRYESYLFFKGEPIVSIQSTAAPPPGAPPPFPSVQPNSSTPVALAPTNGKESSGKGNKKAIVIVIPVAVGFVFVLIFTIGIVFRRRLAKKSQYDLEEISTTKSLFFGLSVLKVATDNFADSRKLGQGGFGIVYKGTLPNGEDTAVKRLSASSRQGIEQLKNELVLVAKLRHKNLVRLQGVCLEEGEKLLAYEFVPNGSLDNVLFDPIKCRQLHWGRRSKIIRGIAQGLLYLHEETDLKIIHRDLKASNILLDEDMNPKISDFGLARLFKEDASYLITKQVAGTFGYMAPEYVRLGKFSMKLDVYSFGILVLEIVSSKKNGNFEYNSGYSRDILSYAREHWRNGTAMEIMDPSLGDSYSRNEVLRCIQIALLCTQEAPADRPLMSSVFLMLQSPTVPLQEPLQPRCIAGFSLAGSSLTSKQSDSAGSYSEEFSSTLNSPHYSGPNINQIPPYRKEEERTLVQAFKSHTT